MKYKLFLSLAAAFMVGGVTFTVLTQLRPARAAEAGQTVTTTCAEGSYATADGLCVFDFKCPGKPEILALDSECIQPLWPKHPPEYYDQAYQTYLAQTQAASTIATTVAPVECIK